MAHVGQERRLRGACGHRCPLLGLTRHGGLAQLPRLPLQLEHTDDVSREHRQGCRLLLRELARLAVDRAERADGVTVGGDQRGAGVEADPRVSEDERVVREALVHARVRDDEQRALLDRPLAEGDVARRLGRATEPDRGLEPLARSIDQRDRHDGDLAYGGDQRDHLVERYLRRRIEDL